MFGSWVWLDLTHVRMYVEQGRMEVAGTGVEGGDHQHRHDGSDGGGAAAAAEVGRQARVLRYKEKRRTRLFSKTIRYEVRKLNAERRPRIKVSSSHTCPQKKYLSFLPSFLPSFQTFLLTGHKSAVLNLTEQPSFIIQVWGGRLCHFS